jgi:hypothetical protein
MNTLCCFSKIPQPETIICYNGDFIKLVFDLPENYEKILKAFYNNNRDKSRYIKIHNDTKKLNLHNKSYLIKMESIHIGTKNQEIIVEPIIKNIFVRYETYKFITVVLTVDTSLLLIDNKNIGKKD